MSDAWQERERLHAEEVARTKKKYYELGLEDGKRAERKTGEKAGGSMEGLVEGQREDLGVSLVEHNVEKMSVRVRVYMSLVGGKPEAEARQLGWTGTGDVGEFLDQYIQREGDRLGL